MALWPSHVNNYYFQSDCKTVDVDSEAFTACLPAVHKSIARWLWTIMHKSMPDRSIRDTFCWIGISSWSQSQVNNVTCLCTFTVLRDWYYLHKVYEFSFHAVLGTISGTAQTCESRWGLVETYLRAHRALSVCRDVQEQCLWKLIAVFMMSGHELEKMSSFRFRPDRLILCRSSHSGAEKDALFTSLFTLATQRRGIYLRVVFTTRRNLKEN